MSPDSQCRNTNEPIPGILRRKELRESRVSSSKQGCSYGDVNSSWRPTSTSKRLDNHDGSGGGIITLGFGIAEAVTATEIRVPILVYDFDDIGGYQFTLEWDPGDLEYLGARRFGLPGMTIANYGVRRTDDGLLTTAWDDVGGGGQSLANGSALFTLYLRARKESLIRPRFRFSSAITSMEAHKGSDLSLLQLRGVDQYLMRQEVPGAFALLSNYPNPFNPTTTLQYSVPETGLVILTIHNALGQIVTTLVEEVIPAGLHHVTFDTSDVPSGVYYYRLSANYLSVTRRMVFVK